MATRMSSAMYKAQMEREWRGLIKKGEPRPWYTYRGARRKLNKVGISHDPKYAQSTPTGQMEDQI